MAAIGGGNPVPGWQRASLDAALIALVISGALWLLVHYTLGAGREDIGLPHWSEVWLIRVHGLAGFVVLIAVGAFLPLHLPRGWRMRQERWFEIAMLSCLVITVISAYCLYYFAPESTRAGLGWLHAVLGVAWGATIVWHRRKRRMTSVAM